MRLIRRNTVLWNLVTLLTHPLYHLAYPLVENINVRVKTIMLIIVRTIMPMLVSVASCAAETGGSGTDNVGTGVGGGRGKGAATRRGGGVEQLGPREVHKAPVCLDHRAHVRHLERRVGDDVHEMLAKGPEVLERRGLVGEDLNHTLRHLDDEVREHDDEVREHDDEVREHDDEVRDHDDEVRDHLDHTT